MALQRVLIFLLYCYIGKNDYSELDLFVSAIKSVVTSSLH